MPINPNKAFAIKNGKHNGGLNRRFALLICCIPAIGGCGNKIVVSRDLWVSDEDIVCTECGQGVYWELL